MAPVSLDDPRVHALLRRSKIARLATRSPAGMPFVTPIWFVLAGSRVVMGTSRRSLSVRNLSAHPEAVLVIGESGVPGAPLLRLRGAAAVRLAPLSPGELARIAWKYFLPPRALRGELANLGRRALRQRYYAQAEPAVIRVTPESAELLASPLS